jgi:hypothetical protein
MECDLAGFYTVRKRFAGKKINAFWSTLVSRKAFSMTRAVTSEAVRSAPIGRS